MTEAERTPRSWHAYHAEMSTIYSANDIVAVGVDDQDAIFIAASPEMLDALEEVVKHGHNMNCPYGNRFAWDNDKCFCGVAQAEAAIAKAKGETR